MLSGNKDADYIKIGKFGVDDNRFYLEIGSCCFVIFRGIITVEMFTSLITSLYCENNAGLIDVMKNRMQWGNEVNAKFSEGCTEVSFFDAPYFEYL